jgi:1-acyl-sn-glycerol-3-phosphate acyltransferase
MAYPEPFTLKLRREFLRRTFRQVFRLLFKLKISGWENIPPAGAYLIAHNHVSIIEPAFILSFWKTRAEAIGAQELWTRRGQAWIIKLYGTIPVRRGEAQRELLRKMLAVLNQDSPLLIAPEGTRSHVPGMKQAEPGIGYLIDQADALVVPVGIIGSTDANLKAAFRFEKPALEMRIGTPFRIPPIAASGQERRAARQHNADAVMLKIGALLPEEYWGVYAAALQQTKTA